MWKCRTQTIVLEVLTIDAILELSTFQRLLAIMEEYTARILLHTGQNSRRCQTNGPHWNRAARLRRKSPYQKRCAIRADQASQVTTAPVAFTTVPRYPIYLLSQTSKVTSFAEQRKSNIHTIGVPTFINSSSTLHFHDTNSGILYRNHAMLQPDQELLL